MTSRHFRSLGYMRALAVWGVQWALEKYHPHLFPAGMESVARGKGGLNMVSVVNGKGEQLESVVNGKGEQLESVVNGKGGLNMESGVNGKGEQLESVANGEDGLLGHDLKPEDHNGAGDHRSGATAGAETLKGSPGAGNVGVANDEAGKEEDQTSGQGKEVNTGDVNLELETNGNHIAESGSVVASS